MARPTTSMKLSGRLGLISAAILAVSALLPWRHITQCIEVCGANSSSDWNVFEVGGGQFGPSSVTASAILILIAALLLAAAGIGAMLVDASRRSGIMCTISMFVGALVALLASLVAPIPKPYQLETAHILFETMARPGAYVCIVAAVIGLVAAVIGARSTLRRRRASEGQPPLLPVG